jgi:3-isopropylmalate/(R)-2-methylmalate dehydratase small subunit
MPKFTTLTSHAVLLPLDDVDTGQIIPARFLKVIDTQGLGEHLFTDWRFLPDGTSDSTFALNQPESQGAQILIVGDNFGCGSSREHAPWALLDWGFRALISTSFADIFHNNALKNGLLPVILEPDVHRGLVAMRGNDAGAKITIDLEEQTLMLPNGVVATFPIDPFSKHCLLEGVDPLNYLLSFDEQITNYEVEHGHF